MVVFQPVLLRAYSHIYLDSLCPNCCKCQSTLQYLFDMIQMIDEPPPPPKKKRQTGAHRAKTNHTLQVVGMYLKRQSHEMFPFLFFIS